MHKWAFVNEDFVLEENARLQFRDLAIQRGYGVFDFSMLIENIPVFLDQHLRRFFYSAAEMHLPVHKSAEELTTIIYELIEKNNLPQSGVRITLTGGYSQDGYQLAKPNLIISQHIFPLPGKEQFQKGIKLVTYKHQRQLAHIKTIDYLIAIWLQPFIRQQAADDVLYYNDNGITECPRSNVFIVTNDDTIVTPKDNILEGITRTRLLEIAARNFKVQERNISPEDVRRAREVFITSTTKNILPVYSVNGNKVDNGKAGDITRALAELLQTHHQQAIPQYK